jgi:hypothetical protein
MKEEDSVFEFVVGKTAPTQNHSFVMIKNDKNIYQANGNLKSNFDRMVEDFRDKKVMEFKEASLKKVTLEKDGKSRTLIPQEVKKETEKDKGKTMAIWTSEDGASVDNQAVSTLLSTLTFLKCQKYLDSLTKAELEKTAPLCKITFENEGSLELILFKGDNEDKINGISSMNGYAFELSRFNGREINSTIDKLLGIQRNEKKKE